MKKLIGIIVSLVMVIGCFGIVMADEVETPIVLGAETEDAIGIEVTNETGNDIVFFNVVEAKDFNTDAGRKELQQLLKDKGFYNDAIDGSIGPKSKEAIVQFNKDCGLGDTAVLGETYTVLIGGDNNMLPKDTKIETGKTANVYVTKGTGNWVAIVKFDGIDGVFVYTLPIGETDACSVNLTDI